MKTKYLRFGHSAPLCMIAALLAFATACNSKSEDEPTQAVLSSSTAVTAFKLKADRKVMRDLDSVYFSIDLDRAVIFNADSLPQGTDVSKIVPSITLASGCQAATITMTGGKVREGQTNYLTTPGDSIDFTGDVRLTVLSQDGQSERTYALKVNVHKIKPDSLTFDKEAVYQLPSRLGNPLEQKSIERSGNVVSIIRENDGTLTLARTADAKQWTKEELSLPFAPHVRSFATAGGAYYLLNDAGLLYTSADALTWQSTGKTWAAIVGAYGDELLGLRIEGGKYFHTSLGGSVPESEADAGFPVADLGNLVCLTNKWADAPTGLLTGGTDTSGAPVAGTWGFDGQTWARLSSSGIPALAAPTVAPYFIYKKTNAMWLQSEFSVLLAFGGRKTDGSLNADTYISMNNGVSWDKTSSNLSLPAYIEPTMNADAIILSKAMNGSLENAFTRPARVMQRLNYQIEGYDIAWDCPYIYLFGGVGPQGALNDLVWRGVLARLTFMPLI